MAKVLTRRRLIVGIVALVIVGAIGGSVAMRLAKKDEGKGPAAVTLEFAPSDLTLVERRPLSRWLPVSGALQPVRQATVKFTRRFREVEADMRAAGRKVSEASAEDLDRAWEAVKVREHGSGTER